MKLSFKRNVCLLGFVILLTGCGALDRYREGPPQALPPAPQTPDNRMPASALLPPPALTPDPNQLPPNWYWSERQNLQTDRQLQEQRSLYEQNRQPPLQFQRPPICNSQILGGQVITTCR